MSNKTLGEAWARSWGQRDSSAFAAQFDAAIEYTDNAFDVRRSGHDEVREHHHIWLAAVPDFAIEVEEIHEAGDIVVVQGIGSGTFDGEDLAGGELRPTGKKFRSRLSAVLVCGPDGIVRCDEYYDRLQMPGLAVQRIG